jgi:hypothetical protein
MALIEIKDKPRGPEMLVGLVVLIILGQLWLGGSLDGIIRVIFSQMRGDEGMTSATYVIVDVIAQLIFGVGVIAVAAWSGLWAIVQDVLQGVRMFAAKRRAEPTWQDGAIDEYTQALIQTNKNVEALQAQIDAMRAETTWAKARATGDEE